MSIENTTNSQQGKCYIGFLFSEEYIAYRLRKLTCKGQERGIKEASGYMCMDSAAIKLGALTDFAKALENYP